MRLFLYITFLLFFVSIRIFSQTDSSFTNARNSIDDILDEPSEELDNSDLLELMEDLLNNPLDLNTANEIELQKIPFVDFSTAKAIVNYRLNYGKFFSTSELFSIPGLNKDLVKKIIPFLTVFSTGEKQTNGDKKTSRKESSALTISLRSRYLNSLQTQAGFLNDNFKGSKPKIYNRFKASLNNRFSFGLLTEKDAGEKSINDFTSGYLELNNFYIMNKIILGDYTIEFGQGLALWSPYGFVKGTDAIYPAKKHARGITSYKNADESNFLRGFAAQYSRGKFDFDFFFSNNNFDARVDSFTNLITSVSSSGFHRTESELNNSNTANERIYGLSTQYKFNNNSVGLLYYRINFSNSFNAKSVFDFKGNAINYYSFYLDYYYKNFNIFGEAAYDGKSVAVISSVQLELFKNFNYVISIRSYPRNYINFHGYGFGEKNGNTSNEFGIYTGLRWRTEYGLLNFYFDQFNFPYPTSTVPFSSSGNELLLSIQTSPIRKLVMNFKFKNENKEISESADNIREIFNRNKRNYRLDIIYDLSSELRIKGRFEYNKISIDRLKLAEDGVLFYQDIKFSPSNNISLGGRIVFFQTDSFQSAVFEYENDLAGILSNIGLFGKGLRWYLISRYRISEGILLSLKYSETFKSGEKSLSSGNSLISGNIDNRLSLQLDVNL